MDVAELTKRFKSADFLSFDQFEGLTRMRVHTPDAQATIFLQGAHLTAWEPAGAKPVIFVSRKSDYAPGKPIRGGIPVVFPWFATDSKKDRVDGHPGPSHGFARIQEWDVEEVRRESGNVHLTFGLGPTAMSRSMGFDHFKLTLEFVIGTALQVRMTVRNDDDKPLQFEEAFHTYYQVTDVHEVVLTGLEPTSYIDKTDNFKVKAAAGQPLRPTQFTDRVYNATAATCTLHDIPGKRLIRIRKTGSNSTVVFNPWKPMPDLDEWEWHEFLAVEAANVGVDANLLAPQQTHTMQLDVSLAPAV